jgi:hypothetical protein
MYIVIPQLLYYVALPMFVDRITEFPTLGIIPVATIGGSFYLYRNGHGLYTIPVLLLGTGLTYTEFRRSDGYTYEQQFKSFFKKREGTEF